jgi:hypothetical protein
VRVIRLERHDCHKQQHRPRRDKNGIHQGQPLPGHVHEDGDDQPCFHNHEQQDQRPPEISMDAKEVDEIRASAQDKQPAPDHQIKLNRVLLSLFVRHFFWPY